MNVLLANDHIDKLVKNLFVLGKSLGTLIKHEMD